MSATAARACHAIVDELLKTRIADLGDRSSTEKRLDQLDHAVKEIQAFAASIRSLIGNFQPVRREAGRPTKSVRPVVASTRKPAAGRKSGRPARQGHRGPGDFPAKSFVLESVRGAGRSGIRPRDIVAMVSAAAPGRHVRPSALVSTILARLRAEGLVTSRGGSWYAA